MTIDYNVTFEAGFTTETNSEAKLHDLHSLEYSGVMTDNGGTMDIMITAGQAPAAGYFSLLAENRMLIKKVSLVDIVMGEGDGESEGETTTIVTNLNLPIFDEPEIVWRGGKAFYLYSATGGTAVTIPAGTTKMFRLKYRSLVHSYSLNQTGLYDAPLGTLTTPFKMKANTSYNIDYKAFERTKNLGSPRSYLVLPGNLHIADELQINMLVTGEGTNDVNPMFVFNPAGEDMKINGVVRTENLIFEANSVRAVYTGEESMGWVLYVITYPF